MRVEQGARRRSTGLATKQATALVQLASALCFLVAASFVEREALGLLLCAEALGQILLALENLRRDGDDVVRYFGGPLGRVTLLVFSLTLAARVGLGANVFGSALAAVVLLAPVVSARWPRDLCGGLALTLSALSLAVVVGPHAALGQLAYAAVLVGGVALLRPWQAELINVPVFLAGCWFLQNGAPRFVS
jgi:hypothetical protein